MKKRKGAGYIIEGIISVLVLLIFVAGSYSGIEDDYNWVELEQKTETSDLTYTLKQTEDIDRLVERGETGAIRGVSSSLLNRRMSVAGSVKGLPTGNYLIGVYVDSDKTETVTDNDLTDISNNDRCEGDLEEISPNEGGILRTQSSGNLESTHNNVRLYFADSDPGEGRTDRTDYDSVWVDNRTKCQFTRDEGPYRLNDFVSLEGTVYKFDSIDGSDNTTTFQRSELSYELKKDFNRFESADVEIRRFNFSDDLDEYDMLIFKDRDNIDDVNSNPGTLLDYLRNGRAIFAMQLTKSNLENLPDFGLQWVDISQSTVDGDEMFGVSDRGQEAKGYFNQLGYTTEDLDLSPDGSIASGNTNYMRDSQILASSKHVYNREEWDAKNDSMVTETDQPAGIPNSDCADPYRNGSFEFPEKVDNQETLYAYNIKLSGTGCSSFQYGVAIDKDKDGDMDKNEEGVFLDDEVLEVNKRTYRVEIDSHDNVSFRFVGDRRKELFSYVNDLENQRSEGFGRFPSVSGSSPQPKIAALSSLTFMMVESDRSFGSDQSASITTSTSGRTADGDVFSINLRWLN